MRHLCPICRAECDEDDDAILFACDALCINCTPTFDEDDPKPPFPWRRRAQGIVRRAKLLARRAEARGEYTAPTYGGTFEPSFSSVARPIAVLLDNNVPGVTPGKYSIMLTPAQLRLMSRENLVELSAWADISIDPRSGWNQ